MCVGANCSPGLCFSCWPPQSFVFNYLSGRRKHEERKKSTGEPGSCPGAAGDASPSSRQKGAGLGTALLSLPSGSLCLFLIPFSPPSLLPPQPSWGAAAARTGPLTAGRCCGPEARLSALGEEVRPGGGGGEGSCGGAGIAPHRSARCGTGAAAARLCAEPREGAVGCAAPGCRRCPPCSGSP